MSNYYKLTRHPITGKYENALWIDNEFGPNKYGVKFSDGQIFNLEHFEMETKEDEPENRCHKDGCGCKCHRESGTVPVSCDCARHLPEKLETGRGGGPVKEVLSFKAQRSVKDHCLLNEEDATEKELKYCPACIQMTNHLEGKCLKCPEKKDVWVENFKNDYCRKHHRAETLVCGHLSNGVVEPWSAEAIIGYIRQNFIPRAEVEAKYENCPQCTGLREELKTKLIEKINQLEPKLWDDKGKEFVPKSDLLDLLTQQR